nr:class I lanthipeptide [uncultured Mucilaginibacter sp.]
MKKLTLDPQAIAILSESEMKQINGGYELYEPCTCCPGRSANEKCVKALDGNPSI